jgi:hypothetical protein
MFIVDEMSMLIWTNLAELDSFWKELTGRADVPFGGLLIILAGDFYQ